MSNRTMNNRRQSRTYLLRNIEANLKNLLIHHDETLKPSSIDGFKRARLIAEQELANEKPIPPHDYYPECKKAADDLRDHRMQIANQIIIAIACTSKRFFRHGDNVAYFDHQETAAGNLRLKFRDHYTDKLVDIAARPGAKWRGFTGGGTMRGLIEVLRDFITHGQTINLDFVHWGYKESDELDLLKEIQRRCEELGTEVCFPRERHIQVIYPCSQETSDA